MFKLSQKSKDKLQGVHPDLVKIVLRAIEITEVDFGISEGLRTKERQEELYKAGKSKTLKSRHLIGQAVDVVAYVNGQVSWELKYYQKISEAFHKAALELNLKITWGGSWVGFVDGPHFQIEL